MFRKCIQRKQNKDKAKQNNEEKKEVKTRVFTRPYNNPFIKPVPTYSKPNLVKPTVKPTTKPTVNTVVNQVMAQNSNKAAALIGLNYTGTSAALNGCINDANRMRNTLQNKYNYHDVKIFTDLNVTVKHNVLEILDDLIKTQKKNLFFQFSGHGTYINDKNGDEADGQDECLYSVGNTLVVDDDIEKRIAAIPKDVTVIIVIDACHSGSIIDLPFRLDSKNNVVQDNQNVVGCDVICISGCQDDQTSADVTNGGTSYGALSNSIQIVLSKFKEGTWRQLVDQVRQQLVKDGYDQIPQLTVSRKELIDSLVKL